MRCYQFRFPRMIEADGKLINRPTQTGGKTYDKFFIYVPIEVARDSAFPFKTNERIKVKIDITNKRLIIEKSDKDNTTTTEKNQAAKTDNL